MTKVSIQEFFTSGWGTVFLAVISFIAGTTFKALIEFFIRKREQSVVNQVRKEEEKLSAVRDQILAIRLRRATSIDDRRVEALLRLWKCSVDAGPLHLLAKISESINYDSLISAASKGDEEAQKVKAFADSMWKMASLDSYKADASIESVRPLVPQIVWAIFSAYKTALLHPLAQLAAARSGVDKKILADSTPVIEMVRGVLPHFDELFSKYGAGFLPFVASQMKEKLLVEISKSLDDSSHDERELERANAILAAVSRVEEIQQRVRIQN